jgi:hypothetical protein
MRLAFAFVVFLASHGLPGTETAPVSAPWEAAVFSADPKEMREAADKLPIPEGASSEVLLDEGRYSFDAEGRCRLQVRTVVRVLTPAGANAWSSFQREWSPWFEERPVLRARVISNEGVVHQLDHATIAEEPLGGSSSEVYSDRRRVRAPLPAVEVGSILELEYVSQEKEPLFKAGQIHRFYFGYDVPTRRTRLVIEAPMSLPLKYVTRKLGGIEFKKEERRSPSAVFRGPGAAPD